jgi:hypothetical protein
LPEVAKKLHPLINRNVREKWSIDQHTEPVEATLGPARHLRLLSS